MKFKSGDKVNLVNWRDARWLWSKRADLYGGTNGLKGEIFGIRKRNYDNFREQGDLVIRYESTVKDSTSYCVYSKTLGASYFVPEFCLYSRKEKKK